MTPSLGQAYNFAVESADDAEFRRYLQGILNEYHRSVYPLMEMPKSKKIVIKVTDSKGNLVGGAILWVYWGWLEISVLALEEAARGQGLGRRLMAMIEQKGCAEGCTRARVEAFEGEVGFYQRLGYHIVGQLDDYPPGYCYYWMQKDLASSVGA